jgi:hypothetical protein
MFLSNFRVFAMLRQAIPLAALLALGIGTSAIARADTLYYHSTGGGFYTVYYFDSKGNLKSEHYYGPKGEYFGSHYYNNNPEGDGSGGGAIEQDAIDAALEMAKKLGGGYTVEDNGWELLFQNTNIPGDFGPNVTDPWHGSFYDDGYGGGEGGGGYDPNVPLGEQLPSQPGSDDDDDGDGVRRPDPADAQDFDPDVIDPAPTLLQLQGFGTAPVRTFETK